MRRFVAVVVLVAATLGLAVAANANAQDVVLSDEAEVRGTDLWLPFPADWNASDYPKGIAAARAYFSANPTMAETMFVENPPSDKTLLNFERDGYVLLIAHPSASVIVSVERRFWWDGFDDWTENKQKFADLTKDEVLSIGRRKIGPYQAFTFLQREGSGVFGLIEIRLKNNRVASISISLVDDNAALAQAIMDGVHT